MKVVVTGGSGFLGSHVADALVALGHEVFVVDHHVRAKALFPNPAATIHTVNIGHDDMGEVLMRIKPEVIVHLAAQISVTKSLANPAYDAEKNIINALKMADWAKKAGVQKIIFSSSGGAIYGDHPVMPTPELAAPQPLSPYGIGKLTFERYLELFAEKGHFKSVSLRFANLYGPRQQILKPANEGAVIPIFLDRLLVTKEPITVFGEGDSLRDFVFVEDAVDAIVKAIDVPESYLSVNIGTGEGTSVNDLLSHLFAIHGNDHPIERLPFRTGEVKDSVLSYKKAKKILGWKPKTAFKDGLKKTYDWYKKHFGSSV
jgi:UDP-glucose 4-epimerase